VAQEHRKALGNMRASMAELARQQGGLPNSREIERESTRRAERIMRKQAEKKKRR